MLGMEIERTPTNIISLTDIESVITVVDDVYWYTSTVDS